jgi:hypothetical protein
VTATFDKQEVEQLLAKHIPRFAQIVRAQNHLPHNAAVTAVGLVAHAEVAGVLWRDAFALLEGESGFRNVFGHDAGGMFKGRRVTRWKLHKMIDAVRRGHVSNGVGVTQLTSLGFILAAEALGGAQHSDHQTAIGLHLLGELQHRHGRHDGFAAYNGGEGGLHTPGPQAYARAMMERADRWVRIFHG